MEYFWIIIVVAVASFIKGMTGFGFALIALPLLIHWFPPKEIIPVLVLCNLLASLLIVLQRKERKLVNKSFRNLIIHGGVFTIVGVIVFKHLPDHLLLMIMAIFFIVLSTLSLLNVKYTPKLSEASYKIAGSILGFLTGTLSVSGPPLALFLNNANVDNQEFREIFAWFSIVTATVATVGYQVLGLITPITLKLVVLFFPILFAGSYFGKRMNSIVPTDLFKKITIIISLFLSVFLLFK